jgi:NADPH:quinone reductase-like Zn-dependent oxidoreductase
MKAVIIHEYGNEDVLKLEEIPVPEITSDEVLIKIHAAGINPVDWKVREGYMKGRNLHTLPLILGWDLSGTIEKAGIAVTEFHPGDEVYCRPAVERNGAYAEYISVRAGEVARKPKSLSHIEASGVPLAGITAWEALVNKAEIKKGQKVLIHAASGGVGTIAVQIAKAKECYVIGTTSGHNVDLVKSLGADEVIDYTKQEFSEVLSEIDVVFDTLGGTVQDNSWKVIKKGGFLVSIARNPEQSVAGKMGVKAGYVFIGPNVPVLNQLTSLIEGGKIKPVIDSVFRLEDIKKAHLLSQSGRARGKIIIEIVPEKH